jgi:hypothetical protein
MDAAVPAIEVADNTDALRAGSPDGEVNALNAFQGDKVRAKFLVRVVMAALAHEIEVKLGEDARESIRVVDFERFAVVVTATDLVGRGGWGAGFARRQDGLKKTFVTQFRGFDNRGRRNRDVV